MLYVCLLINYVADWYVLIKLADQTWIKFDDIASLTIFFIKLSKRFTWNDLYTSE